MKKMFPKHSRNIVVDKARNVFEVAVSLYNKGHKAIVMVVGSDRVDEFDKLLNTYNGVEARHGFYGFDNIEVVSAGERDPDAEGVTGMSASKMRAAAGANDFDSFKQGLPSTFKKGMSLFKDVRRHMGIRESFITHQVQQTEEDVIRDMYVEGKSLQLVKRLQIHTLVSQEKLFVEEQTMSPLLSKMVSHIRSGCMNLNLQRMGLVGILTNKSV